MVIYPYHFEEISLLLKNMCANLACHTDGEGYRAWNEYKLALESMERLIEDRNRK